MRVEEIDIRSLQCLVAAARHQNFRAAAQALSISPAAFGKRISSLERNIGGQLSERSTRRVFLTARGEQAVESAIAFLKACTEFTEGLAESRSAELSLTIATRFELGLSWILPALTKLEGESPGRKIHLAFGDSEDMLDRVQTGRVDASVTSARRRVRGEVSMHLHEEEYVFVASRELAAANSIVHGPRKVNDLTLLDIDQGLPLFRYFASEPEALRQWEFERVQFLGTIAAIRQQLLAGGGVAVLPRYFVSLDLQCGDLVQLFPSETLKKGAFRMAWLPGNPKAAEIEKFGHQLKQFPLV